MNVPELNIRGMTTPELREAYYDAAQAHAARWKQAKTGTDSYDMMAIEGLDGKTPVERIEEMSAFNTHVSSLKAELDVRNDAETQAEQALRAADALVRPGGLNPAPRSPSGLITPGEMFARSEEYAEFLKHPTVSNWRGAVGADDYDFRAALVQTGAGFAPPQVRTGRVELTPLQPPSMLDVIPVLPTDADNIRYMEETTYTNAAAEVAEQTSPPGIDVTGAQINALTATPEEPIPEAALAYTERNNPIEWLPVQIPVTIQQLQDVAGIQALIDSRLAFMVEERLDNQVLKGTGNTPQIRGTLSVAGINTKAKAGGDDIFDKIHEVLTDVRKNGQVEPDTFVVHPDNWHTIRTKKDNDGNYIYGPPYLVGDLPVFGMVKVVTSHVPANTAILGAYRRYSNLFVKRGMTIDVTDSHGYEFAAGIIRIRVYLRCAMVHYRPKAFGSVTGLNS